MDRPSYRGRYFWGVADWVKFNQSLDDLERSVGLKAGWFMADNLIAFGRNLGFVTDEKFVRAWQTHAETAQERGLIWRAATAMWAARQAARRKGDFIECGCYRGTTARILLDLVDLRDRQYFLYDLFEHGPATAHLAMEAHGASLFAEVSRRFEAFPNVHLVKGPVPASFAQGLPERIAFAHIDMNNAPAEIGALDAIADRLVPGAVILLDDFGALPYREQHLAEKQWFAERGIDVLELPTSQGLAIW